VSDTNSVQPSITFTPTAVPSLPSFTVTPSDSVSRVSDVDSHTSSLEERFTSFNMDIQKWKLQAQQESQEQTKSFYLPGMVGHALHNTLGK
jgi:hypothetical protein